MPRRPSKKSKGAPRKPRGFDPKESKMRRWERPEDIPMDAEDQFHSARDKILLDGEGGAGDDEGDEDEVFALKGMPEDESEDEDEDEDVSDEDHPAPSKAAPKSKSKGKGKPKDAPPTSESEGSESEEEGWGKKKSAYYSSNAAQIESDDEEAHELEEAEARRLQARARDALGDADFGLEDAFEVALPDEDVVAEEAAKVEVQSVPKDRQAALRHLEKTSPETLALARDWDDIAHDLMKTKAKLAQLEADEPEALGLGMVHLYYQTLLTYATTLAFYLHLAASPAHAARPEQLRTHPVLARLLTLKQAVSTLEDLNFSPDTDESDESEDESVNGLDEEEDAEQLWRPVTHVPMTWRWEDVQELEPHEMEELMREAAAAYRLGPPTRPGRLQESTQPKKEKTPKTKAKAKAADAEPPKKKRKTAPALVFDLVEPDFASSAKSSAKAVMEAPITDVYGDATTLQRADATDKATRQKSLRFITQRIESTSTRRKAARAATGGDDDIPYRERRKEREARLKRELAQTRGQGGADLDGEEPAPREEGKKRAREGDEGSEGEDGYYDLVARKTKEGKERKKAEYDAARLAERVELADDADGPRAPTKAILKNKGLTPHRSKSVRNPRVKKRQRYEKAKKKLSSQKAVYKGGLNETGGKYAGEKSGISKIVKSVRL